MTILFELYAHQETPMPGDLPVYSWTQDSAPGLPDLLLPHPFPPDERLAGESAFFNLRG
jgi:hypothetical protein